MKESSRKEDGLVEPLTAQEQFEIIFERRSTRFSRICDFHLFQSFSNKMRIAQNNLTRAIFYSNSRKMSARSVHSLNRERYNMHHRVKMAREPRAIRLNANLVLHYAQSCKSNVKRKWLGAFVTAISAPTAGTSSLRRNKAFVLA